VQDYIAGNARVRCNGHYKFVWVQEQKQKCDNNLPIVVLCKVFFLSLLSSIGSESFMLVCSLIVLASRDITDSELIIIVLIKKDLIFWNVTYRRDDLRVFSSNEHFNLWSIASTSFKVFGIAFCQLPELEYQGDWESIMTNIHPAGWNSSSLIVPKLNFS